MTAAEFEEVISIMVDSLSGLFLFFPMAASLGLMIGTFTWVFRVGGSYNTDWYHVGISSVTDWRKRKLVEKVERGKLEPRKSFFVDDFLAGEADFDYSEATVNDLISLIDSDRKSLTAGVSMYDHDRYEFYSSTAPHERLIARLAKLAEPSDPLKPAASQAVKDALNTYRSWSKTNTEAWIECQAIAKRGRDHIGHYVVDAVAMTAYTTRAIKLEQNEKQAIKALDKALKVELDGVDTDVSYADLLKGKIA